MKRYLVIILSSILLLYSCTQDVMTPTGAVSSIAISPSSPSVERGNSKKFAIIAYDKNQNLVNVSADWYVQGGVGIIDSAGHFYAPQHLTGPFPMSGTIIARYQSLRTTMPITINLGIYSIYSDIYAHHFVYDRDNPPQEHGGWLLISGNTNYGTLSDDTANIPPTANKKSLKIKLMETGLNFTGAYWMYGKKTPFDPEPEDLSQYANAYLHFYIKTAKNCLVKIESDGGTNSFFLNNYITPNNTWQKVVIPLSDASSVDFTQLTIPVSFYLRPDAGEGWTAGEYLNVGEIMYSPSANTPD